MTKLAKAAGRPEADVNFVRRHHHLSSSLFLDWMEEEEEGEKGERRGRRGTHSGRKKKV